VHLFNAQLYEDLPSLGLGPYSYSVYDLGSARLRMNLVRAVTNTYVSQICRSKPKARVLTDDGPWDLKQKARGLQRWGEGKAEEIELYDQVSDPVCLDSGVFGTGWGKVFLENPQAPDLYDVGVVRVFPWELMADDAESQVRRRLRNICQRSWYDRSQLAEWYPKHRDYIMRFAPKQGPQFTAFDWAVDSAADLVRVYELWHLPSYEGAGDGLHCLVIEGKTLFEKEYKPMRFPFVPLYRDRPTMGIWGVSIPHELRGIQTHINQTLLDCEECLHLYGKPKWIMAAGSVPKNILDDDVDSIIEFTGTMPPTTYTPTVMPAEQYAFLWQCWQKGFDIIGTSQARSEGETPEGLSGSGASIRAWNDVEDGRLYKPSEGFENWHLQIFDRMIDLAREIAEERPDYASAFRGKKYVQVVSFRDVDPGKDKYYLARFPESRLSKSPAMRLAQLNEMLQMGTIGQDEFRELLDFPDLESDDNLMTAPRRLARMLIDRFLEAPEPEAEGVFLYPDPAWPLAMISQLMTVGLAFAQLDGAPEGNLRLMRQFLQLADQLKAKAAPPALPAGPPGAPPPGPGLAAAPAPPPALPMGNAA